MAAAGAGRAGATVTPALGRPLKTPVTIITGFLGAGKTTLLNYILKDRNERNISVIENEFGEVNIDNQLVSDNLVESEDLISLDNGCVCCSLRKDVVKALAEIERRSRYRNKRVDQVILETTGLADPAPVAFTFFANPWIASRFRIDSIVCVCDTRHVLQHLDSFGSSEEAGSINEAAQQLAFADLILLNKTDLVTRGELDSVRKAVREINCSARLIECRLNQEGGRPPLSEILDSGGFSVHKALQVDPHFLESDSGSDSASDADEQAEASSAGCTGDQRDTACNACHTASEQMGGCAAAAAASPAATTAAALDVQEPGVSIMTRSRVTGRISSCGDAMRVAPAVAAGGGGTSEGEDESCSDMTHLVVRSAAVTAAVTPDNGNQADQLRQRVEQRGEQQQQWRKRTAAAAAGCAYGEGGDAWEAGARERNPKRRRKHMHDVAGISSVGIVARGQLDEYRFNMFMRDLLVEKGKDIFRCKGVLAVHGYGSQKFVFQGVHETICYGPGDKPWGEDEPRINQIVFIGRGLNRKALMKGFETCIWHPLPEGWREAFDPVTKHPYYYNPITHEKTWARPQVRPDSNSRPDAVTVTPLVPMQQPRSLQPSKRRSGALPAHAAAAAGSHASAPGAL